MKTLKNSILCFVLLCGAAVLMAQAPQWQWAVKAEGTDENYAYSIEVDNQGNQYVIGVFRGTTTFGSHTLTTSEDDEEYDIFVAKLDADGNWLWAVQAGGLSIDHVSGIALDSAGNAYITGAFAGTANFGSHTLTVSGWRNTFVAKLDADGNWLWAVKAGGTGWDDGYAITLDAASNIYVTGGFTYTATFGSHTLTASGMRNIYVAKMDADGNWLWATQAEGSIFFGNGYSITLDGTGNMYVTGSFEGVVIFGSHTLSASGNDNDYDIFVAKLDPDGNWLWAIQAGGLFSDWGYSIALDNAGNIYMTGWFAGTATFGSHTLIASGDENDIFVAKLDANGNWLWVIQAEGEYGYNSSGSDIDIDSAGNVYVVGTFEGTATFGSNTLTAGGVRDAFVAKLNANGHWLWAIQAEGDLGSRTTGSGIDLDSAGNVYVIGSVGGTATFGNHTLTASGISDIFVAKLDISTPIDDDLAPQVASRLHDAWPNPFNKATGTLIKADIPKRSTGTLSVYNLRGQHVASYKLSSGTHEINFAGENLPAGIYFYSLQCGSFRETKKLVLLR